jgi:hypothetical protein
VRRPLKDASLTLLFAVITAVSAVALAKTVASPFQGGSFGVAEWAMFVVTVAGGTFAFVRSVRYWASLSLLTRLRPPSSDGPSEPSESASPERRMHPILDDLTWGALALTVVAINVFAVWAVVVTVGDLLGDSETAAGWLLWQLALLTAAATGLGRLGAAFAAELRDRARRRHRNAVHVVTGKLLNASCESSSTGRRAQQVAAIAATAALALVSLASASGPLLEPAQDPDSRAQLAKRVGEGRGAAQRSQGTGAAAVGAAAPPAQAAAVPGASRRARGSQRSSGGRAGADDQPTVAPVSPAASPPSVVGPAPTDPPADTTRPTLRDKERAARKRRRHHAEERRRSARKRRQHQADERRRSAPTPPPPTATPPAPTTPTPSPPVTPCDPSGDPALQPPCGEWQGALPPE